MENDGSAEDARSSEGQPPNSLSLGTIRAYKAVFDKALLF